MSKNNSGLIAKTKVSKYKKGLYLTEKLVIVNPLLFLDRLLQNFYFVVKSIRQLVTIQHFLPQSYLFTTLIIRYLLKTEIRFALNEIININFRVMKTKTVLVVMLLVSSHFMFSQEAQDSLGVNYIYAPNHHSNNFSAEESWEIHRAAYIKQLNAKGQTEDEIKTSMITYEKDKAEFIARVKEQLRFAAIQREKAAKLRAVAKKRRDKAAKRREEALIQRQKARTQREASKELRGEAAVQRTEAAKQRKQAAKQRKLAAVQRKKDQLWRKHAENILIKNITFTEQSSNNQPVIFNVSSKTTLRIGIIASISSGSTLVEIYNPNGIKKGELTLNYKSHSNNGDEYTSAALDKTISGATVGDWQVKISSQNSEGTVDISVAQYKKPAVDD